MDLLTIRNRATLASVAVLALLGAACGGDDAAAPVQTPTTLPGEDAAASTEDDSAASRDASDSEARLLPACGEVGDAVEAYFGEEVVDVSRSMGGGLTGGVAYSTMTCTVETQGASYEFQEYLATEAPDGTSTNPLALWEHFEADAGTTADADERAEQLAAQIEAAGAELDGVLDDDGDLVLLMDDTTYKVSFAGIGVNPTPADLEGLVEVAIAVARDAPGTIDALCEVTVAAAADAFGGSEGDTRLGGGGGFAGDITYETQSCSFDLRDSDLRLETTISDRQHWEAANARIGGSFSGRAETQPVNGIGDGAFTAGEDLLVRIGDQVVAIRARTSDGGERQTIPPADLVGLAGAVLEG